MSCLGNPYNPSPTRIGSRVDNLCSNSITNQENYKGNILQYKKNSSNLTKQQRYALIAQGKWTSRTKTSATQSTTYTNPNTLNLKRVNVIENIYLDGTPTNNPATPQCSNLSENDIIIPNGGSLVNNTQVNPCNPQQIISQTTTNYCAPTSASDVPGPIITLCYNNEKQPTYYPRQRYQMSTSLNKFPYGYKFNTNS